jgi:hypothetical protein
MALLSGLIYGPGFLRSSIAITAANNDLSSILHYRELSQFFSEAARVGLATWERHLDYLTPQHIVWSLANEEFSNEQRERVARALLNLLPGRVWDLPPTRVAYPGPNFTTSNQFWPADGSLPWIDQFVTHNSFLVFNILSISSRILRAWWESPVAEWSDDPASPHYKPGFHQLKVFASRIHVVNDAAERFVLVIMSICENFGLGIKLLDSFPYVSKNFPCVSKTALFKMS